MHSGCCLGADRSNPPAVPPSGMHGAGREAPIGGVVVFPGVPVRPYLGTGAISPLSLAHGGCSLGGADGTGGFSAPLSGRF